MKKYILTESQIRNLVNNVVDEAKGDGNRGKTKYTPEYLEKIKEKYKGRPFNDFRSGEDKLVYKYITGQLGREALDDFTKDMVRQKHKTYTKDDLRDIAKQYDSIAEFIKKGKGARHAAIVLGPFVTNPTTGEKKNTYGFYDSITSHMTPLSNLSKRLVYAFEFYDEDEVPVGVYVGLTYNVEKRKTQHETGINLRGVEVETAVTKFKKENPTYTYKFKELTDYIDANESIKMEKYWENKYFNEGWVLLNIAPTGSLGGRYNYSNKKLIEKALECETYRELQIKYAATIYSALRSRGLLPIVRVHFGLPPKVVKKTDDEYFEKVKKYKSYDDFLDDVKVYNLIIDNNLLPRVKEYFNLPPDKKYIRNKKDNTIDIEVKPQNEPIE